MTSDEAIAIAPIAEALETLGVRYYIGGSVASSVHGVSRSTLDVDIVIDIHSGNVDPFLMALGDDYYADANMIRDAIQRRGSFNVIHTPTMIKIDAFVAKARLFDRHSWDRIIFERPYEELTRTFPIASPEDVILNKLEWFRQGGEVSERQMLDVIGVMRVQADRLDNDYLDQWAPVLGIADLLERARAEAD